MKQEMNNDPIGIFDSGVGGLTVASAIRQMLPEKNLVYFGDTAHLPYGDKSPETIMAYSRRITRFLLEKQCRVIVIACNTASANALDVILEEAGDQAIVVDVINPVVDHVIRNTNHRRIGVIGTKSTINSGSYAQKLVARNPMISVSSLATPLLVPMIEEGFIFDDISNAVIRSYLSKPEISNIDALILGCTHYPIIKNQISKYYNFALDIIDSSNIVAGYLRNLMVSGSRLSDVPGSGDRFYVSDYTDYFQAITRLFFGQDIKLEKADLWN